MQSDSLAYLLQTRDARRGRDRFPEKMFGIAAIAWLVMFLILVALPPRHGGVGEAARIIACTILSPVTGMVLIGLPLRQISKDASIHASFFGGNCYQEILGTLLRPRDILDQIARHSIRQGLKQAAPWAALSALLWTVLFPAIFLKVLLAVVLWAPVTALFIFGCTYQAQELAIWNSQLKDGALNSLGATFLGAVTVAPFVIAGIIAAFSLGNDDFATATGALVVVALTIPLCRYVCVLGIERLPHVRLKLQQLGRKIVGHRRNPWVPTWSQNPIVVRERTRDASRMPGGLLGALAFQLPLFFGSLLLVLPALGDPQVSQDLYWFLIAVGSIIQSTRAGRRCTGAIVGEIENKTLESMLNTRLHAREYVRGWLEVATVPLLIENLLILVPILAVSSKANPYFLLVSTAIFLISPLVGASVGLYSSVAKNREQASRRFSEVAGTSVLVWLIVSFVNAVVINMNEYSARAAFQAAEHYLWPVVFLLYIAAVGTICWKLMLRRIEITN